MRIFSVSSKVDGEVDIAFARMAVKVCFFYLLFMALILMSTLTSIVVTARPAQKSDIISLCTSFTMTLISYLLSRSRFVTFAPGFLVASIISGVFFSATAHPEIASISLSFASIAFVITGIFYSFRLQLVLLFGTVSGLYFLSIESADQLAQAIFLVPFNFILITILAIFQRQREADVQSMKVNQDRLEVNEAHLRDAQSIAKIGSWIWDLKKDNWEWSSEMQKIFGLSDAQLATTNMHILSSSHIEDRIPCQVELDFSRKTGKGFNFTFRSIRTNGEVVHVRAIGKPWVNKQGFASKFSGTCQDISDEIRFIKEIEKLNTIVYRSLDLIAYCDDRMRIEYQNDAFSAHLGNFLGSDISRTFAEADQWRYAEEILPSIISKGSWDGELAMVNHDGKGIPCHAQFTGHFDRLGHLSNVSLIAADLSHQKEVEHQLELERANAAQNAKFSALGEMAGGIAHEINNPLMVIKMSADFLLRAPTRPDFNVDKVSYFAQRIDTTVDRIAKIVSGLKLIARDGTKDPFELTPVQSLLEETVSFCETRFRCQNIKINTTQSSNLRINCRRVQIMQVMLNLITNAFDAVSNQAIKEVSVSAERDGDYVLLSVSDSGPGVPAEIRDRIMLPFFTTKDVGKGSGLGLSISRTIAEEHGGSLYLKEDAARTTFVLKVALAQPLELAAS